MKYIANLSTNYGHHTLPLLLFYLFFSKSHVKPPIPPPKKAKCCLYTDGHTDRHTLAYSMEFISVVGVAIRFAP